MLLELQHVIKRFGGVTASSDISFSVEEGQIYGIIGPNGAGKTTLFNLITGVYQVSEGDILFRGRSPIRSSVKAYPSYRKAGKSCRI